MPPQSWHFVVVYSQTILMHVTAELTLCGGIQPHHWYTWHRRVDTLWWYTATLLVYMSPQSWHFVVVYSHTIGIHATAELTLCGGIQPHHWYTCHRRVDTLWWYTAKPLVYMSPQSWHFVVVYSHTIGIHATAELTFCGGIQPNHSYACHRRVDTLWWYTAKPLVYMSPQSWHFVVVYSQTIGIHVTAELTLCGGIQPHHWYTCHRRVDILWWYTAKPFLCMSPQSWHFVVVYSQTIGIHVTAELTLCGGIQPNHWYTCHRRVDTLWWYTAKPLVYMAPQSWHFVVVYSQTIGIHGTAELTLCGGIEPNFQNTELKNVINKSSP